jgi:hypothetical protein
MKLGIFLMALMATIFVQPAHSASATLQGASALVNWLTPDYPDAVSGETFQYHVEGFTDDKFVIKWADLSAIPANATVTAATMFVTKLAGSGTTGTLGIWNQDCDWDATATYNNAKTSPTIVPWANDFPGDGNVTFNDPVANYTGNPSTAGQFQITGLAAGVQAWICSNPYPNYGFLIDGVPGASYHYKISGQEGTPPNLVVTYTDNGTGCSSLNEPKHNANVVKGMTIANIGGQVQFTVRGSQNKSLQLSIYGIDGKMVARLQPTAAGSTLQYSWNGGNLANGIFYAVSSDKSLKAKSFALVR